MQSVTWLQFVMATTRAKISLDNDLYDIFGKACHLSAFQKKYPKISFSNYFKHSKCFWNTFKIKIILDFCLHIATEISSHKQESVCPISSKLSRSVSVYYTMSSIYYTLTLPRSPGVPAAYSSPVKTPSNGLALWLLLPLGPRVGLVPTCLSLLEWDYWF